LDSEAKPAIASVQRAVRRARLCVIVIGVARRGL